MTHAVTRKTTRKRAVRAFNGESAKKALQAAEFGPGMEAFGFNKGQFSVIDLIEAALSYSGPADVTIATWTAADADLRRVASQLEDNRIRKITWLVDYSFETRQPVFCRTMRSLFGDETIRTVASHAKFALISNDDWKLVLQTSMNLNQNKRLENFWLADDPDLFEAYSSLVTDIFDLQPNGEQFGKKPSDKRNQMTALGRDQNDMFEGVASVGTFAADLSGPDDL